MNDSKNTNAIGPGTKNMTINVPEGVLKKIDKLSAKSGMTRSKYLKLLIEEEVMQGDLTYEVIARTKRTDVRAT